MEAPLDDSLQFLRLTELLMLSPLPVFLDPAFTSLLEMIIFFESSSARVKIFEGDLSTDDPCPAKIEYAPLWNAIHEKTAALVAELNATAKENTEEITQLVNEFEFARTKIIANCPKDDCPDREGAQAELGWKDGKEVLQ